MNEVVETIAVPVWMSECGSCGKKHRTTLLPCPSCGVYETPQPVSERVREDCWADYDCEGCEAYRDHLL